MNCVQTAAAVVKKTSMYKNKKKLSFALTFPLGKRTQYSGRNIKPGIKYYFFARIFCTYNYF